MSTSSKIAVLLFNDALIGKGLELLLNDMQLSVISAHSVDELNQKITSTTEIPDLILCPLLLADNRPAIYVVRDLRKRFSRTIPAILLSEESTIVEPLFTDKYLTILPEQIKPSLLREKINQSMTCSEKEINLH